MAKQVNWNKNIYETFVELAMLNDEEQKIMLTRIRDNWTITKQASELGISESSVKRMISRLKKKYDEVQKLAPDRLPPRRTSKIEEYMDNN